MDSVLPLHPIMGYIIIKPKILVWFEKFFEWYHMQAEHWNKVLLHKEEYISTYKSVNDMCTNFVKMLNIVKLLWIS